MVFDQATSKAVIEVLELNNEERLNKHLTFWNPQSNQWQTHSALKESLNRLFQLADRKFNCFFYVALNKADARYSSQGFPRFYTRHILSHEKHFDVNLVVAGEQQPENLSAVFGRNPPVSVVRELCGDGSITITFDPAGKKAPTIYLTENELIDFQATVAQLIRRGVHKFGIAKVVVPEKFRRTRDPVLLKDLNRLAGNFQILKQEITKVCSGIFEVRTMFFKSGSKRKFSYNDYFKLVKPGIVLSVNQTLNGFLASLDSKQTNIKHVAFYAADLDPCLLPENGDLFRLVINPGLTVLNLGGINKQYAYLGSRGASFGAHCEDCNMFSLNQLIVGAGKSWLGVPANQNSKMIELFKRSFPARYDSEQKVTALTFTDTNRSFSTKVF